MLTPPALATDTIIACLRANYALGIRQATFLPIGADVNTAVYRVEADEGTPYFLKLRRGDFDEAAVSVPAFLHAQGIVAVMAPLATVAGRLWAHGDGFAWILYPYFEGRDGYAAALSEAQWVALGASLRAVHAAVLPLALARRVPREDFASRWRAMVLGFDHQVATWEYDDPVAARLAAFWHTQRETIRTMVARAEQLGGALREGAERVGAFVLCHADLHPGNVLVGTQDALAIVDWDNPIFAPRERDLMCLGGGVCDVWDDAREEAAFYRGYGSVDIDLVALAYYRYERIVADLAAYGTQIFGVEGSVEDREEGLRQLMGQFQPHQVVAVAHRTFQQMA